MLKYIEGEDSFSMSGVRMKLTPSEMIKIKQTALEYAYKFLINSGQQGVKTLDVLKKADTIVGWMILVDYEKPE